MWILILIYTVGYGAASTSVQFHSKASCEKAQVQLTQQNGFLTGSYTAICFEDKIEVK